MMGRERQQNIRGAGWETPGGCERTRAATQHGAQWLRGVQFPKQIKSGDGSEAVLF